MIRFLVGQSALQPLLQLIGRNPPFGFCAAHFTPCRFPTRWQFLASRLQHLADELRGRAHVEGGWLTRISKSLGRKMSALTCKQVARRVGLSGHVLVQVCTDYSPSIPYPTNRRDNPADLRIRPRAVERDMPCESFPERRYSRRTRQSR